MVLSDYLPRIAGGFFAKQVTPKASGLYIMFFPFSMKSFKSQYSLLYLLFRQAYLLYHIVGPYIPLYSFHIIPH